MYTYTSAHTHTHTHTYRKHTLTLYLFGLMVVDDVDPHSSRMGIRWCHGLLLWDLEIPIGHISPHRAYMCSLWSLNLKCVGTPLWSLEKGLTECLVPKAREWQEDPSSQRPCDNACVGLNELGSVSSLLLLFLWPKCLWWPNDTVSTLSGVVAAPGARSDRAPTLVLLMTGYVTPGIIIHISEAEVLLW